MGMAEKKPSATAESAAAAPRNAPAYLCLPMPVLLSVVVITLNEEANIARCLQALGSVADDVLVVDSFSTDNTVEICRRHGARVIQHAFAGYVEQKNYATAQAKFNHVLQLDADEVLTDELRRANRNTVLAAVPI